MIAEMMRHAVAEEMFVYLALEEHMPNGAEEVEHDKHEHDEIVQLMKQMENLDASDPAFMERVQQMDTLIRHHANDEKTDQFPQLRAHILGEKLVDMDMGRKVQNANYWCQPARTQACHTLSYSIKPSDPVSAWLTGSWTSSQDGTLAKMATPGSAPA